MSTQDLQRDIDNLQDNMKEKRVQSIRQVRLRKKKKSETLQELDLS